VQRKSGIFGDFSRFRVGSQAGMVCAVFNGREEKRKLVHPIALEAKD
jgi:hypothetical protein